MRDADFRGVLGGKAQVRGVAPAGDFGAAGGDLRGQALDGEFDVALEAADSSHVDLELPRRLLAAAFGLAGRGLLSISRLAHNDYDVAS